MFKWCLLLVAALAFVATPAAAHTVGLSQSDFVIDASGRVHAEIVFARTEAIRLGHSPSELRRAVESGVFVASDHVPCPATVGDIGEVEGDGLRVTMDFACPSANDVVDVDLRLLRRLDPGHRHALRIASAENSREELLSSDARTVSWSVTPSGEPTASRRVEKSGWQGVAKVVELGATHILTGWDHLLFLFALLLGTRERRAVVLAVTSFTVAHSVTLALAALDVVTLNARLVECAIAASIAYVAYENVLAARPAKRWRITFVFGLVHGFGFASGLRELRLDDTRLLPTLVAFNGGVELGQLLVVLLLFPLLARLRNHDVFERRWFRVLSIGMGITGVVLCAWRMAGA